MDWPTFWAPNLVQWIVGGSITALVSATVGLTARYFLKRWWAQWGQPWFEQKLGEQVAAAAAARDSADQAAAEARSTKAEAQTAGKHLDIVGQRLKDVLDDRDLATRLDDLLTAYVRLRTITRAAGLHVPDDLDPPHFDLERTQALTSITGRHLLSPHRSP